MKGIRRNQIYRNVFITDIKYSNLLSFNVSRVNYSILCIKLYFVLWFGVLWFIHLIYQCIFEMLIIENGKRYSSKGPLHFNGMVCIIICMKFVNDIKKNGNSLFF